MHALTEIKIKVQVADLLVILRKNRAAHVKIVAEARLGYIEKAKEALAKRLEELEAGSVAPLHFNLRLPSDYTAEYDTAIGMFEMTSDRFVEIGATEYRTLVQDQWGWGTEFLVSNAAYSSTGVEAARAKGLL